MGGAYGAASIASAARWSRIAGIVALLRSLARFPGARMLYVLPHADDELFVAGLLAANVGQPQTLVWLTQGGLLPRLRAVERSWIAAMLERRLGVSCFALE